MGVNWLLYILYILYTIYIFTLPFLADVGSMPPVESLAGIPVIADGPNLATPPTGGADGHAIPPGISVAASLANLLPAANESLSLPSNGVYVGDGLVPVPAKLAARIREGNFIDMGELLPEFWCHTREEDGQKPDMKTRRNRKVTDIFTWLQCYGTYVSVRAASNPALIAELMAYMIMIVRTSQDFAGLAWVRYDAAFRRQAALTGNTQWSQINATLYNTCFTGLAKSTTRCELCLATTHTEKDCALQGSSDPSMQDRIKTLESLVLAITPKQSSTPKVGSREASGEVCRLWNQGRCTFARCRHTHACGRCGGMHQLTVCPLSAQQLGGPTRGPHITPKPAQRFHQGAPKPY